MAFSQVLIQEPFMNEIRVPELSIVIPVFNEEQSVKPLHAEIEQALADFEHEILYVDDGSTDNSFNMLTDIQQNSNNVRLIRFRRNFGQTAAMSAGFKYARGKIIIPMDADGQNDPADIPKLVEGTLPQHRVTKLSPRPVGAKELTELFKGAMQYW